MNDIKKGKLITFEGCEGVGKSKQIKLLYNYLVDSGQNPLLVREPGGTNISEGIREVILDTANSKMSDESELLLYMAARAQLVREIIAPELKQGRLVLCDRFIDSSLAYQGFARGLGVEIVEQLNNFAIGECMPDLTIFLDLNPKDAFKRKGGADSNDRLEQEEMSFHLKVYDGYKWAVKNYSDRVKAIAPTGTVEQTQGKIRDLLREKGLIR